MGWASTPYDPRWAERYPRRQAMMSAAGPTANLLLAALAFAAIKIMFSASLLVAPAKVGFSRLAEAAPGFGPDSLLHPLAAALSIGLSLNLLLFLFNLLPLPPLDGSGVVRGLFPESLGRLIDGLTSHPMMGILGLVVAWQLFPHVFMPLFLIMLALLHQ